MNPLKNYWSVLIAASLCASTVAHAQQDETNRLTLSARFGFNISAHFKGLSTLPPPSATRKTPRGDNYNYDDGYVLTDQTGNFGGQSWYWGYDNSAQQISGNNIVLNRSTVAGNAGSVTPEDEISYGAELLYSRLLYKKDKWRFGLEVAGNYGNLSLSDSRTLSAPVNRTSYPFPFAAGTTPPGATPDAPYQGSYEGPGFVIGDTPGESTSTIVPNGASIAGNRKFDANLWGFRVGPYVEYPLNQYIKLSLSGGFAGALVDAEASWRESVIIAGSQGEALSGSGHTDKMQFGFYAAATLSWQFAERWSALAGVQYQDLGDFTHAFGGRAVQLDLSSSIFATIGVSWSF
jgi:hypothetical protein